MSKSASERYLERIMAGQSQPAATPAPAPAPSPKSFALSKLPKINFQTILILALGVVVVWLLVFRGPTGNNPLPGPAPLPSSQLAREIQGVMVGPGAKATAKHLANVCDCTTDLLARDWRKGDHHNTREEAAELIGQVGYFATIDAQASFPAVGPIIQRHFSDSWERNSDGKLNAGELTAADKQTFSRKWTELRDAFNTVK